jgi:hypothetical protein
MLSSVWRICPHHGSELRLPFVAIGEQLLFIVQKLLSCLGGVLSVWTLETSVTVQYFSTMRIQTFHNRIDRAAFLAEATVNAFRHVNIISRSPSATVFSLFCFDCDG